MSDVAAVKTKRVGPPCVACNRPLPVSGIPKTVEAQAKLLARLAKLQARADVLKGITEKVVAPKVVAE